MMAWVHALPPALIGPLGSLQDNQIMMPVVEADGRKHPD
jgi:hypothetical protein